MAKFRGAKILVMVGLVFATFAFSSVTYAWFTTKAPIYTDAETVGELSIVADMEDASGAAQVPGFHKKKLVTITNTGSLDAVVRVDVGALQTDVTFRDGRKVENDLNFTLSLSIEKLGWKVDGEKRTEWFAKDGDTDKYYVLLSPEASASFNVLIDADAQSFGREYMGAAVNVTQRFLATQNMEGALVSMFGDDYVNYKKVNREIE